MSRCARLTGTRTYSRRSSAAAGRRSARRSARTPRSRRPKSRTRRLMLVCSSSSTRSARCARRRAAVVLARRAVRKAPAYQAERERIDEVAAGLRRNARAYCRVHWGTYQLIEAADDQSRKDLDLYDYDGPCDPRFARWNGNGQVSVQIIKGLDVAAVHDGTQVRIGRVDAGLAWESPVRSERRRFARTYLEVRVGTDEHRGPVWASWPMVQHRPLPAGRLKRVTVSRRMRGPREEGSCEITLDTERAPRVGVVGAVAIDIGWRLMPGGGIRVASWLGTDGESGELRVEPEIVSGLQKVESLSSI